MKSAGQDDNRRLLITGAGGFVGRHAVASLVRSLHPGDRLAGIGRKIFNETSGVETHQINLLDQSNLAGFIEAFKPTHVLHLAAMSSVSQASSSPGQTWRNNLIGLLNLCEAIVTRAAEARVFFVSSGEVYGRAFLSGSPIDESVEPLPANPYAKSKRAGELLMEDILGSAGVRYIILRPFNHIGPGQDERFVVASLAGQIARIEAGLAPPILEVGDLTACRDFLDVFDVVQAYKVVIERCQFDNGSSIYNVASGCTRSIADILSELSSQARVKFEVKTVSERMRPSEIPIAAANPAALNHAFGWYPTISLKESLQRVLNSARIKLHVE